MLKSLNVEKIKLFTLSVDRQKSPENQWEDVNLCTKWQYIGVTLF